MSTRKSNGDWSISKSMSMNGVRFGENIICSFSLSKSENGTNVCLIVDITSKKKRRGKLWGMTNSSKFEEGHLSFEEYEDLIEDDEDSIENEIDPDFIDLKHEIGKTNNEEEILSLIDKFIIKKSQENFSDFSHLTWK